MIQCHGCTCAGWLWEGEGGLGDHQPGVYVPLKALFLVTKRKNNAGYKGARFTWIVGYMCILALQDADLVTYLCHASAYTPLSCRFRELYVNWHEH